MMMERSGEGISTFTEVVKGRKNENKTMITMKVQEEGNGWLYRSAVAKIWHLRSAQLLQEAFINEGASNIQVRSCGRKNVILTFP